MCPDTMVRQIDKTCPKCSDYFGVTVTQIRNRGGEPLIIAYCAVCVFQLKAWRLFVQVHRGW